MMTSETAQKIFDTIWNSNRTEARDDLIAKAIAYAASASITTVLPADSSAG